MIENTRWHKHLLTEARVEIAANDYPRSQAERAALAERVAQLEQHNGLLTEALSARVTEFEQHRHLLTEAATASACKLQERDQSDYQLVMAQQQLLAGIKDADPRFHHIYEKCKAYTMTSVERLYSLYKDR